MHIAGLFIVALAGAAVWYWRVKMVRETGGEMIDSVERMRGAFKRRQFGQKTEAAPLTSIAHPAIAAVAFFLCLANEKPAWKDEARNVVRRRMNGIIAPGDMDEVLVFADWAVKDVTNPVDPARRFRELWSNTLSMDERHELIAVAGEVSDVGCEATPEQAQVLQALRRTLLN